MVNGANDCYLSAALSEIALAEQSRLGKDCPFTVIATCSEDEVHHKAAVPEERESLAGQISRRTSTWARRIHQCHKFLVNRGKKLQGCDLTPAASRYLIFEDFDDEDIEDGVTTFNQGPRKQFESVLLQCLTRKLPSIAIQTHVVDAGLAHLVELASRNIPVLLLDTVERAITTQRDFLRGQKPFTQLAREADSFPVITRERLEAITIDDDDGVTLDGRNELLDIAMELIERKWAVQIKHGVVDVLDASLVAFLHSTLQLGARVTSKNTGEKVRCLPRIIRCLLASHIYSTVLCSMLLLLLAVSPPPPPPLPLSTSLSSSSSSSSLSSPSRAFTSASWKWRSWKRPTKTHAKHKYPTNSRQKPFSSFRHAILHSPKRHSLHVWRNGYPHTHTTSTI